MAVTTSIGPGATNLVTAAALAHVNRLPVLLLPGDIFVSRAPDPVLQQVEDFHDGGVSANDCFKPVSRYFDRIVTPEQLLTALPRAVAVMTDPALCGPVTLALPQDIQAQAYDYPADFFEPETLLVRATPPDAGELERAAALLRAARRPVLIAGGGVLYAQASDALRDVRRAPRRTGGARRRPANRRCRGTIRCRWARSASPGRRRPTRWRAKPISCSPSARACRTSPPARMRCSRRPAWSAINVNPLDAREAARRSR